ncbi:MAG: hypothetical protein RLY86_663 [Pseudomonadota bacterium]
MTTDGQEEEWIALLRDAARRMGNEAAGKAIGKSRPWVSRVLNGTYDKDPSAGAEAVLRVFKKVSCPFLEVELSGAACLTHQRREAPATAADEGYWHARACRACRVGVGKAGAP